LLAHLSTGNLAEVQRREFISRSRLRPVEDRRMQRAPNEKGCRAVALSSRRPRISNNNSNRSNEAVRLLRLITARDTRSRKVGSENKQDKRHRQASNNFGALTPAALEHKVRSRFVVPNL